MNRRGFLGGSDIAAILGLVRQRSPLDVWLEKTGRAESFGGNEATELGSKFEPVVLDIYAQRTGNIVMNVTDSGGWPSEIRHPEFRHLCGHVDGLFVLPNSIDDEGHVTRFDGVLEVKCSSLRDWGDEGTDEIPDSILPQCQWYLGLTGLPVCHVAALLWGGHGHAKFRTYTVPADPQIFGWLVERANAFWHDHVLADVAPAPRTQAEALKLWPVEVTGKAVFFSCEDIARVHRLVDVRAERARLKAEEDALKDHLAVAFGDAEIANDEFGDTVATYRAQDRAGFTVEATSYRVLRTPKKAV